MLSRRVEELMDSARAAEARDLGGANPTGVLSVGARR
jgi:hypothetical protein